MDSSSSLPSSPFRTTVLSLPNEILFEIFTLAKSHRPSHDARNADNSSSSADIASVRLVCRRFAAASSQLLVHCVRLDGINSRSLERLESISRCPLISNGVRTVRLEVPFYAPRLASNLSEFARWAVLKVLERARRYQRAFEQELESAGPEEWPENEVLLRRRGEVSSVLGSIKAVLKTWHSIAMGELQKLPRLEDSESFQETSSTERSNRDSQGNETRHIRSLCNAHRRYQIRCIDQEGMRKNNNFMERLATAIARMPKARALELQDFAHETKTCSSDCSCGYGHVDERSVPGRDEYAGLVDVVSLVKPASWAETLDLQLGNAPTEVLFDLPILLQKASCKLDRICIRTTTPAEHYYPLFRQISGRYYSELVSVASNLGVTSFAFIHGTEHDVRARKTPSAEDVAAFQGYIAAMAASRKLERLRLVLNSAEGDGHLDPSRWFSLEQFVQPATSPTRSRGPRSLAGLKDVYLCGLSLHLSDFEFLEKQMRESGSHLDFLTLKGINLISGSWASALEILRRLDVDDKELLGVSGAECSESTFLLNGTWNRASETKPGQRSVVERFINGEAEANPLRTASEDGVPRPIDGEREGFTALMTV